MVFLLAACACMAADKPVTDNAINDNVRVKLAADQVVKGGGLKVEVKDGVVTLSGSVEHEKQKNKASKLAKKVKGVKQVVNNITIQRQTGK
jgi:hyperosmotically inducible periplasmic protein